MEGTFHSLEIIECFILLQTECFIFLQQNKDNVTKYAL